MTQIRFRQLASVMSNQIAAKKIQDVAAMLRNHDITPTQLVEFSLKRIESTSQLNAFITVTDQLARTCAKQSEQRYEQGT